MKRTAKSTTSPLQLSKSTLRQLAANPFGKIGIKAGNTCSCNSCNGSCNGTCGCPRPSY